MANRALAKDLLLFVPNFGFTGFSVWTLHCPTHSGARDEGRGNFSNLTLDFLFTGMIGVAVAFDFHGCIDIVISQFIMRARIFRKIMPCNGLV